MKLTVLIEEGNMPNPRTKLFGADATRVTTDELHQIFALMEKEVGSLFNMMNTNRSFKSKTTHGDVDIIVYPKIGGWKDKAMSMLNDRLIKQSSNAGVHSFLLNFPEINKQVHVDFIVSTSDDDFFVKNQYYSFNDLSAMIGMIGKKNHFKFGSNGFFKRFQDKRGNWHDILIAKDLNIGLDCLDLSKEEYNKIEDIDDAVKFILSSKLFDSKMFKRSEMTQDQKKDEGRPNIEYMIREFRKVDKRTKYADEDHFFKRKYPELYAKVEEEKKEIDANVPQRSQYNGAFILKKFKLIPGPFIGKILKVMSDKFEDLENTDESIVIEFIKNYIDNNK